ncbi:MAG: CocE/NonD family hydrolase [Planctomycetota bacterium]|nr:CocE/NonD family hydrolase [Planctomycetota bacterium]
MQHACTRERSNGAGPHNADPRSHLRQAQCQAHRWQLAIWSLTLFCTTIPTAHQAQSQEQISVEVEAMPTRDGTRLRTRIYRQVGVTTPLPVLFLKTAYGTAGFDRQARRIAARGYVAVTQDSSGRNGSEGEFNLYWGEAADGFDAVTWIREQPWCNGLVGMWGASYMGSSQWLTASTGVSIDALAPTASVPYFYSNIYRGGAYILALGRAGFGANVYGPPPSAGASPKWSQWYLTLPLMNLDKVVGHRAPLQMSMIKHITPDGFWKGTDARNFSDMDFPAQHIVGCYDFMCPGALRAYHGMRSGAASLHARDNQQLILGPWDHATGSDRAGDVVFGETARLDIVAENLKWYDRWFKATGNAKPYPRVRYFMMGINQWRESSTWPPEAVQPTHFYLHPHGADQRTDEAGRLLTTPPADLSTPIHFISDPHNPVPAAPFHGDAYLDGFGPYDQQTAATRPDVLAYATPPLITSLALAGHLQAVVYASANTPDFDLVAMVIDIHPDGFRHPLATGILRATARNSTLDRTPVTAGDIYRLTVDIGDCAATLQPGHRLGVHIQGSYFPIYDRNTNTGKGPFDAEVLPAKISIYHDADRPSHVVLPLLR